MPYSPFARLHDEVLFVCERAGCLCQGWSVAACPLYVVRWRGTRSRVNLRTHDFHFKNEESLEHAGQDVHVRVVLKRS